jgi:crotonobetainyl-CoA:carnitine CoA-transferase CaiB-like acyl-CoA transferase
MKRLPLDGVRVADLTMMWAGPFATKLLAEMGAEVLKIESPSAWDNIRTLIPQPGVADPLNSSYYFNSYNRDKRSVTLDLAQDRGREVFLRLVSHCDVLVENYRAEVLDKLGLSEAVLRGARPDLVIVSMAGFGKTGAERDLVGFGPVIEMMSGLTSLTGYGDDGVPYKCGVSYGDPVAGMGAAGAAVLGLIHRRRTGKGTTVDLAQREVAATLAAEAFVAASRRGETAPVHHGNRHPLFAPSGCYRCADRAPIGADAAAPGAVTIVAGGDEQWIVVSVHDDGAWQALAAIIGRDDLAGLTVEQRREQHDALDEAIAGWCAGRDAAELVDELQTAGVAAGRVIDTVAVHEDPHLLARGFWVELPHPRMPADWKQPGPAWRFVEANPTLRRHAPLFGEHTREVLGGLVGLSDAELDELAAANIIGDAPLNPGIG